MVETARYGTWRSPIEAADVCHKYSHPADDVFVDPVTGTIYHTEGRPAEGGRGTIVFSETKRDAIRNQWDVRSTVHEYGGAPASAYDGIVYFSNAIDNRVHAVGRSENPQPITPENQDHRFAKFAVYPTQPNLLVAILEDHTKDRPEDVVNSLCLINSRTRNVTTLVSGADFYSAPCFSPDGLHIAWEQWDHPDMPWEGGQVCVADVLTADDTMFVRNAMHIAGMRSTISATYPQWASNDILIYTSDESGYQNPWKYSVSTKEAKAILEEPVDVDFSLPRWYLGWEFSAPLDLDAKRVLYAGVRDGRSYLYVLSLADGEAEELECPFVNILVLKRVRDNTVVFRAESPDSPESIVLYTLDDGLSPTFTVLSGESAQHIPRGMIAVAKSITLQDPTGDAPLHTLYYPPTNPHFRSLEGEKPPCIVNAHGGPTAHASQGFKWEIQFFTSRGFAWVDVNYSGSCGYGREYIERLNGNWGVADVKDCIHAMRALSAPPFPLIDANRTVIRGRSAGGYIVLSALCMNSKQKRSFAAGTSMHGPADIRLLAEKVHKFQLHHIRKLMGGPPAEIPQVYEQRSPLLKLSKLDIPPLLIMQGTDDAIVPPEQADAVVNAVKTRGGTIEYRTFIGESHGWRKRKTIELAVEQELAFYRDVLRLSEDDALPTYDPPSYAHSDDHE